MARLTRKRFAQFAILAFMAGEISYAAAEVLILRSIGPSARRYPAGQRVPDSTTFTLRPGDSVVILAGGGTRTFRGPGTFGATGPVAAGALASNSQVRRNTGAVRGSGNAEVERPDDIWQIDVTQSGRACVSAGGKPILWRPAGDQAVKLTITPQSGAPVSLDWARGEKTLAWPSSIALADGSAYQLSWTGANSPTRLTTYMIGPMRAGDVDALATALLANQCRGQLDVLIAQRETADGAPAERTASSSAN